jgi:chromatin modification-related protein VID21
VDPDADGEGEVEVVAENAQQVATVEPPRGIKLSSGIILSDRFKGPEQLTLVRAPVLDSAITTGIVDIPAMEEQLAARNGEYTGDGPLSLEEVFPDLTAYAGPMPIEEGHAPKYRLEEGQMPYHRPAHTSRIMDLEPIFVSTLQPATNERDGSWDLQDGPWYDDYKGSTEIPYEVLAASTSIFQGRTARVTGYHQSAIPEPSAHKLRAPLAWTPEEDAALQKLVAMYPFNWHLIADSFNSEVVTIPTERRLPYDCYERWDLNFGPDAEKKRKIAAAAEAAKAAAAATAAAASAASTNAQAQAVPGTASTAGGTETNGAAPSLSINTAVPRPNGQPSAVAVPTLPGQNAEAGPSDAPPPPGLSKREAKAAARNRYEGSKKAIRHQAMFDAVRRLSRRRDATKSKTSSKFILPHWVHGLISRCGQASHYYSREPLCLFEPTGPGSDHAVSTQTRARSTTCNRSATTSRATSTTGTTRWSRTVYARDATTTNDGCCHGQWQRTSTTADPTWTAWSRNASRSRSATSLGT